MPVNEWYYAINNEQKGPVNEAELKEMLAGNQIPTATLVWQEGMENWTPASSVQAFTFRPPPAAAAPKSAAPPIAAARPAPSPTPAAAPAAAPSGSGEVDSADVDKNKVFAILAYLGILFIVPLLVAKDSPFAKYHANQGLTLFLAWIVLSVASTVLWFIPVIGYMLGMAFWLGDIALLVLMVMGIINAAKGVMEPLPVIGQYTFLK
jgi:uncharacterized membrane protein